MNGGAWGAFQYDSVWTDFYAECDVPMRAALDARLSQLLLRGSFAREPLSKPLGDGIFELRVAGKREIARVLFYFGEGRREITILHAFKKKSRKTRRKEIETAEARRNLIRQGEGDIHALPH